MFEISNTQTASISGNQFSSARVGAEYVIAPAGLPYAWDNNTYHGAANRSVFGVAGIDLYTLANWRTVTGFDANSTATASTVPDAVIVRPNSYQAGRANVIIYSFSGATSASINLSNTGLVNGQQYTIRNAQNYFGAAIASGTYSSSNPTVSVSLVGGAQSVATPVGYSYTPPTSCPQFCPMVVVPN